ncbi:DNA methyltransferase [Enterococcus sp.]|uniref:DNA methyltransferase n=1 Tax=Enterococcus sp. TaxID=35783 RepID=UPI002FC7E6D9
MNVREQKKRAREFIDRWKNKGNERKDSQPFWLDLLQSVYGIENPSEYITFEDSVRLDKTSFIDGYIDATKVMIEQKGMSRDLNKAIKQSDGSYLTPYQQAKRYSDNLPYSKRSRWIITSNFKEFYIYDMERPNTQASVIKLEDLEKEYYRLEFLVDKTNEHVERKIQVSIQAGEIVGEIYESLLKQYISPKDEASLHAINQLIVRLVFCFYAEDAEVFGHKSMFYDYLIRFESRDFRRALIDLFKVLDTPVEERDPYIDEGLNVFPYVNGGMFAENNLEIPQFTDELRYLILEHASSNFDWSNISPTIFGGLFESTLNPETRKSGGMHYTSIENIHKVIDVLFLNELREELNDIRGFKKPKVIEKKSKEFQNKLANLTVLDPACGSGNFLTETYISLRRLENEAIKLYMGDLVALDTDEDLVKVKLEQFYGIEINDFAASVAKTALWIAESQMLEETKEIIYAEIDFLPLKSYTNIIEGNALHVDWDILFADKEINYIIGNPPFKGYSDRDTSQKNDMKLACVDKFGKKIKGSGKIDYVACWFFKAGKYIQNKKSSVCFVATNSIVQGDQVAYIWKPLLEEFEVEINFAYRSIQWQNESKNVAQVQVVIIAFSSKGKIKKEKIIYDGSLKQKVENINAYLIDMKNIFVESKAKPICNILEMTSGNRAADGGNLIIKESDLAEFIKGEPKAKKFIKNLVGGDEMLNNNKRYCLWLLNAEPSELREMPRVMNRIEKTKESRLNGAPDRQKLADTPTLFREIKNPENYLLIPSVSSENRRYIPMGFFGKEDIPLAPALIIPNADLFYLGLLNSNVHMAWVRVVAGRREGRYRYSKKIVYNNFPVPKISNEHKKKIEITAQGIIDSQKLYPKSSLSDLYNELTMPVELRRAHQANDKAVMEAYGMIKKVEANRTWFNESETVAKLFEMYEKNTES